MKYYEDDWCDDLNDEEVAPSIIKIKPRRYSYDDEQKHKKTQKANKHRVEKNKWETRGFYP